MALRRARDQRLLLEELDLSGDSPHATSTAEVQGFISELTNLEAAREEPSSSKDSGWRLRAFGDGVRGELGVTTLADLARRAPGLIRYLALPTGVKLWWDARGVLSIDRSRVELEDEEDDELLS